MIPNKMFHPTHFLLVKFASYIISIDLGVEPTEKFEKPKIKAKYRKNCFP